MTRLVRFPALAAGLCAAALASSAYHQPPGAVPDAAPPGPQRADRRSMAMGDRADAQQPIKLAKATLVDRAGKRIGTVAVTENPDVGVVVRVVATGLPPVRHAIHFHAKGACDGPDFKSAGPHWKPADWKVGRTNTKIDPGHLGNRTVNARGRVRAELTNRYAALRSGAPNTIFDHDGVSVVIHADPDHNGAMPGGKAGPRIACAVIERKPADAND